MWRDSPGVTLITADDIWCFFCDPQKRQTYEWKSSSPPGSIKFLVGRGKRKVYAAILFLTAWALSVMSSPLKLNCE
jgi:hypothetical protein